MAWHRESKRHSLASYGIPSKIKTKTPIKEPDLTALEGGLAENKKPQEFDREQLEIGTQIEMEHTNNPYVARRIASDHLEENSRYYFYLKKAEKKMERAERRKQRAIEREEKRRKMKKRHR